MAVNESNFVNRCNNSVSEHEILELQAWLINWLPIMTQLFVIRNWEPLSPLHEIAIIMNFPALMLLSQHQLDKPATVVSQSRISMAKHNFNWDQNLIKPNQVIRCQSQMFHTGRSFWWFVCRVKWFGRGFASFWHQFVLPEVGKGCEIKYCSVGKYSGNSQILMNFTSLKILRLLLDDELVSQFLSRNAIFKQNFAEVAEIQAQALNHFFDAFSCFFFQNF